MAGRREGRTARSSSGNNGRRDYEVARRRVAEGRLQSKLTKVKPSVQLRDSTTSAAPWIASTTTGVSSVASATRTSTGFTSAATVPRASRSCSRCHRRGRGASHK